MNTARKVASLWLLAAADVTEILCGVTTQSLELAAARVKPRRQPRPKPAKPAWYREAIEIRE